MSGGQAHGWRVKISPATTRPMLIAGGERLPVGLTVGSAAVMAVLAWQAHSLLCAAFCALLLTVGMHFVQRMAKRDPQMIAVYRRSLAYRRHYAPRSTPFRRR